MPHRARVRAKGAQVPRESSQRDPISNLLDPHGWDSYVYSGSDPVNFADPSGLQNGEVVIPCPYRIGLGGDGTLVAATVEIDCPFLASIRFNYICVNRAEAPYVGFPDTSCGNNQEPAPSPYEIAVTGFHIRECGPHGRHRFQVTFSVTITAAGGEPEIFFRKSKARLLRCR
jgi:hypothetical protein